MLNKIKSILIFYISYCIVKSNISLLLYNIPMIYYMIMNYTQSILFNIIFLLRIITNTIFSLCNIYLFINYSFDKTAMFFMRYTYMYIFLVFFTALCDNVLYIM